MADSQPTREVVAFGYVVAGGILDDRCAAMSASKVAHLLYPRLLLSNSMIRSPIHFATGGQTAFP